MSKLSIAIPFLAICIVCMACSEIEPARPLGEVPKPEAEPFAETVPASGERAGSPNVNLTYASQRGAFPSDDAVDRLLRSAYRLAEQELAQFRKSEEMYKDKLMTHPFTLNPFHPGAKMYVKWYRDFTGYEVRDIYRSDSFLWPAVFEVAYNYDLMHTDIRTTIERDEFLGLDPREQAAEDTEFEKGNSFTVIRRYRAKLDGEVENNLPPMPSRDVFPNARNPVLVEGWTPTQFAGGAPAAEPAPAAGQAPTTVQAPSPPMTGMPGPAPAPSPPMTAMPEASQAPDTSEQSDAMRKLDQVLPMPQGAESAPPVDGDGGILRGTVELNEETLRAMQELTKEQLQENNSGGE